MKFGIFANIKKAQVCERLPSILKMLTDRDMDVIVSGQVAGEVNFSHSRMEVADLADIPRRADMIVSMGGDGTMLAAARLVGEAEKPILGINLGGLGFLTEISADEIQAKMEKIIRGEYHIEKRMVIGAEVNGTPSRDYHCLNDMVIERGASPRVIRVDVDIDGEYFNTYIADGLILSTPTGSTAYSLSSWGPIVLPTLESIIINPICPHALTVRPTLLPATSTIVMKIETPDTNAILSVDGQYIVEIPSGTRITLRKASFYVHLVLLEEHSFFDRLRRKLQWGSLPRK